MNQTYTTFGMKSLFQYPLRGKEWGRKLLYLGLFWLGGFIIPVVPWVFALGYFAAVVRRVAKGEAEEGLPEWTDWNRILVDGIRITGAVLVLCIPLAAIFFLGFSFYMGSTFTGIGLGNTGREGLIFFTLMGGMLVLFCTILVGILLTILFGIISAPAITHMVVNEKFAAVFRISQWWRVLLANLGGFLIAFFIIFSLQFAFQLLTQFMIYTVVLCWLLPVLLAVAAPYLTVICAVVFGQAYLEGQEALALGVDDELPDVGI